MNNNVKIDRIGKAIAHRYTSNLYTINTNITERWDRTKARNYYKSLGVKVSRYHMHHTLDGFIVPVGIKTHKHNHVGGAKLLSLR